MPRLERFLAGWSGRCAAVVLLCACAEDAEDPLAGDEQNVGAEPSGSRDASDQDESEDASSTSGMSTRTDAQTSDAEGPVGSSECPDAPAPLSEGELQNLASGPSVFGTMVAGERGAFDLLDPSPCGLEGARVCLFETDQCTETDAAGQFVLNDLPDDVDIEISIEKAGFYPIIRLVHLQGAPVYLRQTRILRDADRVSLLESIDREDNEELGAVLAVGIAPGEAVGSVTIPEGVQITLLPGDIGPYYSRGALTPGGSLSSDELDPDLDATREGSFAIFVGVEPGDYTVRFERDGAQCSTLFPGFGFGLDDLGHVRIRVHAGFNTSSIAALCP